MNQDPRSRARRELSEAIDAAARRHRKQIELIVAGSDGPYDTQFTGAARAYRRERNQAWRDYRRRLMEIRRAEKESTHV